MMMSLASCLVALGLLAAPAVESPPAPKPSAPQEPAPKNSVNTATGSNPAPSATSRPEVDKQDALSEIESTRGGRHWVDAKTAPPKSPAESQACFQLDPGLRIELVAAEPLVLDPVALAFDHLGRMFVVEYADYPIGPPEGGTPLSRVVLLEDTDADGKLDRRSVFAEGLNFAHSLMAYDDGILVGAQTEVLFLKDTDGDNRADVRRVLFQGFAPAHPQMQVGCPRWGIDNWIYMNYAPGRVSSAAAPDKPVDMPRADFRFHPRTLEFAPDSGTGQFGNTIDNWGHRFYCTNRNPIMMTVFPPAVARRNPYAVISRTSTDVGPSGGDTRVYPLVQMKSNYLSHAGTHTSACGTTAYRGTLLGPQYEDNVFVCEPVGDLVTRSVIRPSGPILTAERGRPKADFLASSDTWFRPASLATGPDGGLYVADMYRLWVEHPKFLPDEIAKKLDWRAGEDRGRIWRIVREDGKLDRFTPPESTADLVRLLEDRNGWCRHLAQRLIVERQLREAAGPIEGLLANSTNPYTRLHAIWTLEGLGVLTVAHVRQGLRDTEPHVRQNAVLLAARFLPRDASLLDDLQRLIHDTDAAVRLQLAVTLGESDEDRATEQLISLGTRDGADPWFASAILTSTKDRSGRVLAGVVRAWTEDDALSKKNEPTETKGPATAAGSKGQIDLVRDLATVVGARGDLNELAGLMTTLAGVPDQASWWQTAALSGLATGLGRHRGDLGRTSLAGLLAKPPQALVDSAAPLQQLLRQAQSVAVDKRRALADRLAAIELLGYQTFESAADSYSQLLAADQPLTVQLAAIETMRSSGNPLAAEIVLRRWPSLGPQARGIGLDLLLRRVDSTQMALEGMAAGTISPSILDIDQRVRLLRHGDASIRSLASKMFGGAVSANRREVARQYEPALDMEASVSEGAKVFQRVCSKCHRIDGQGHEVGPDISDVRNRSRDALLYDILDPNRKIEPRFTDYSVVTDDGRIFNGLMAGESAEAVILLQAEGKQQVIPRSQIEEIRASGKSLMPEGVEKEVSVPDMAHLLEFLKSRGVPGS